jgi:hypothetical protein
MEEKDSKSLDILGIKPIGDSVNTIVKGTVEGAAAFLSRICLPAAEEFGLLLKDKVSAWRAQNLIKVTEKAERKLRDSPNPEKRHTHPRILSLTIENSSWVDSDEVQEMWAGLLASSCTEEGKDESNLIFINLLSQLTTSEVKIVNYCCEHAEKYTGVAGWIGAKSFPASIDELQNITGITDVHRLDRELDHLRSLELLDINSGFVAHSTDANLSPSTLALNLYVRCQGSLQSPPDFFRFKS